MTSKQLKTKYQRYVRASRAALRALNTAELTDREASNPSPEELKKREDMHLARRSFYAMDCAADRLFEQKIGEVVAREWRRNS